MSDFQTCIRANNAAFENAFAATVTITRGGNSASVPALREAKSVDTLDTAGVLGRQVAEAFVIAQADYNFGSGAVDPARLDTITDADGTIYDVTPGAFEKLHESADWRLPVTEVT